MVKVHTVEYLQCFHSVVLQLYFSDSSARPDYSEFDVLFSSCRDGGRKRQKVKDSYKQEQQKMYSSIIVGQNGSLRACSENTEEQ